VAAQPLRPFQKALVNCEICRHACIVALVACLCLCLCLRVVILSPYARSADG
jgi:hypothetical protein